MQRDRVLRKIVAKTYYRQQEEQASTESTLWTMFQHWRSRASPEALKTTERWMPQLPSRTGSPVRVARLRASYPVPPVARTRPRDLYGRRAASATRARSIQIRARVLASLLIRNRMTGSMPSADLTRRRPWAFPGG